MLVRGDLKPGLQLAADPVETNFLGLLANFHFLTAQLLSSFFKGVHFFSFNLDHDCH